MLFASSLGLCGGYNANIFKEIKGAIKPGDYVYSIGSKATSYLIKNQVNGDNESISLMI